MKKKSFDRKEELLEAALEEFSAKSFEEASLNRIIKDAGISKGTFYYHFQDKQALYLSLIQAAVDAKLEFMSTRLRDYVHDDDLSIFESLKLQARFGIEFAKEYPRYYLLGLMFLKEKNNEIYQVAMDMLGETSDAYYDHLLEKAMERGDIREGISKDFVRRILAFLLYRFDELFDIKREDLDFDRILLDFDNLIGFIQSGLGTHNVN